MMFRNHVMWAAMISASLLGISGCGPKVSTSSLDGHYEDATAASMQRYRGMQVAIPEHAPVQSVIVGLPLLTEFGKEDLVEAILEAGAENVFVTVDRGSSLNLNSYSFNRLRSVLGSRINDVKLVNQAASGRLTVWARDWAPLGAAVNSDAELRLVDFNYYPNRQADDATARAFETVYTFDRVSVPVYNEGGNFMNNRYGDCMMTTRVVDANASRYFASDMVLSPAQIQQYYKDFAGCDDVYIFPRMPYEGTGHIDMWAKFLSDDTILVGELQEETIARMQRGTSSYNGALEIQAFLNDRASEIRSLGFNVVRIPMPAPIISGSFATMRSYTNSLLVNGTAIIPRYVRSADYYASYEDSDLTSAYEQQVEDIYRGLGYQVRFIESDELIANGGAVHCVTMQLGALY